ncbi:MAG: hypothetical protein ACK559_15605, partial [bacterium]
MEAAIPSRRPLHRWLQLLKRWTQPGGQRVDPSLQLARQVSESDAGGLPDALYQGAGDRFIAPCPCRDHQQIGLDAEVEQLAGLQFQGAFSSAGINIEGIEQRVPESAGPDGRAAGRLLPGTAPATRKVGVRGG